MINKSTKEELSTHTQKKNLFLIYKIYPWKIQKERKKKQENPRPAMVRANEFNHAYLLG